MDQSHVRIWHDRLDQDGTGGAAIIAAVFATMVACWNLGLPGLVFSPEAPIHARIAALERLNRDTRLLVLDQAWSRANSFGMLWPEVDAAIVTSGGPNGAGWAAVRQPIVIIAAG